MNKETIRPILVEEVERCKAAEDSLKLGEVKPSWQELETLLELRQVARLKRAQAELQLWLADQQWARQEAEAREETPTLIPDSPIASRTTKR